MALNRNTGSALGFGIGIIIATVIFSANWLIKNGGNALKTQVTQSTTVPSATPITKPIQQTSVEPITSTVDPNDTIMNRMVPSQSEVINDIQKNLQELYGSKK